MFFSMTCGGKNQGDKDLVDDWNFDLEFSTVSPVNVGSERLHAGNQADTVHRHMSHLHTQKMTGLVSIYSMSNNKHFSFLKYRYLGWYFQVVRLESWRIRCMH